MIDNDHWVLLQSGDKTQFSGLVRDHHHALIALATPIVGTSEADEVVQIAWIKAYKAIATFEGKSQIRTWLSRIVINEAKMQLRARKKEILFSDVGATSSDEEPLDQRFSKNGHWASPPANWHYDSPEELLMSDDLAQCLDKILTAMPNSQRAILEMRDSSELPFEEICNNLSISASNARVLLHRARAHLFKLVDHYQETGEC